MPASHLEYSSAIRTVQEWSRGRMDLGGVLAKTHHGSTMASLNHVERPHTSSCRSRSGPMRTTSVGQEPHQKEPHQRSSMAMGRQTCRVFWASARAAIHASGHVCGPSPDGIRGHGAAAPCRSKIRGFSRGLLGPVRARATLSFVKMVLWGGTWRLTPLYFRAQPTLATICLVRQGDDHETRGQQV